MHATAGESPETDQQRVVTLRDDFPLDASFGQVVGQAGRHGADDEKLMAIDHGAVRIRPPRQAGWGRAVLSYGPYPAQPGMAMSMLITNGHNASENEDRWPSPVAFVAQLLRGTQVDPPLRRALARVAHRRLSRDPLWRRVATVASYRKAHDAGVGSPDNLAVGWFGAENPSSATGGGHGFVVRSAGPNNGTLLADGRHQPALREPLWNVPLQYVVVLRPDGAQLLMASLDGTAAMASPGRLRPLYIDCHPTPTVVWAGLQQRVLGQVGWGIDTRVHGATAAPIMCWQRWFGTAHAADRLSGDGPLDAAALETGQRWDVQGPWQRTPSGAALTEGDDDVAATCWPGEPSGLVRVKLSPSIGRQPGVLVRVAPEGGHFEVRLLADRIELWWHGPAEKPQRLAHAELEPAAGFVDLQVLDDGASLTVVADGRIVLRHDDTRHSEQCGVGFAATAGGSGSAMCTVADFEAHPRTVACPPELHHDWPPSPVGSKLVLDAAFVGDGGDLDDFVSGSGQHWRKTGGPDRFVLTSNGAVVEPVARGPRSLRDKLGAPNGSRTSYEIDWHDPTLADVEVELVNPGTARHQGHNGRGGLLFAQDDRNILLVNLYLNDLYDGASISCFFRVDGYEEVYDAVWNNLGRRVTWGGTNRLRVVFDGDVWTARLDDELVLHRRLSDVYPRLGRWNIRRVGIMTNWEFGEDTGSRFVRVVGRDSSPV